eukprot:TRINITY_DN68729_c0_g1_i1.p1 TRINITY_DN68729_c0_g1~~TRINITY_DN68729_c0_g1_i1.p1  ORF type:complete len:349 (-),score=54.22 TRINITY_DN68729_c0_g1_i1:114-1160(-)
MRNALVAQVSEHDQAVNTRRALGRHKTGSVRSVRLVHLRRRRPRQPVVLVSSLFITMVLQSIHMSFLSDRGFTLPATTVKTKRQSVQNEQEAMTGKPWRMMPLGIPKVAYRIPGAPNAEWVDIYNRLYRERIIFVGKEIDDRLANEIIGVLLYLDSEDNSKPIYLYINSAGGSVIAGLSIYDTMQQIKAPVITINVGLAGSMASFLLASGEKGKRLALPNSRVMIHQALGGAQGQGEDIKVETAQILRIQANLVRMYARMTGKPIDVITQDLQRDLFMSAEEAQTYGIIDQVIKLQDLEFARRHWDGGKAPQEVAIEADDEAAVEAAVADTETAVESVEDDPETAARI